MQNTMVQIGNFFFRYRNKAFPLIILVLYVFFVPSERVFNSELLGSIRDGFAILLAVSGLAIRGVVIGYAYIKRGGMNKKVYADNLVTDGMFSLCRNPLYVGNILIYAGVFFMHGSPMVILLGMGIYLFIYKCIVAAEEAYLRAKFGSGYEEYCASVPRWIPKLSRFKEATEGMEFNIRRVIVKDYTTIATTTIALTLTEGYEYTSSFAEIAANRSYLEFLAGILVVCGIWIVSVRVFKKRGV